MVDELLNQKNGYDINNIQNSHTSDLQIDYIRRDYGSVSSRMSDSASDGSINSLVSILLNLQIECPNLFLHPQFQSELKPMTRSSEVSKIKIKNKVSTSVFFKNGKESVQNEAFENIGDDDL